jgi:hypothetical protein
MVDGWKLRQAVMSVRRTNGGRPKAEFGSHKVRCSGGSEKGESRKQK